MADLIEFLLARIAEDEADARDASPERLRRLSQADDRVINDAGFMQRFTPARILAECEAKRLVVEEAQLWGCQKTMARILALPYADHPDYRDEWRP